MLWTELDEIFRIGQHSYREQLIRFAHGDWDSLESADLSQATSVSKPPQSPYANLINCSLYECWPILKISWRSVHNFLSYLANKQTDKQANNQWIYIYIYISVNGVSFGNLNRVMNLNARTIHNIFIYHWRFAFTWGIIKTEKINQKQNLVRHRRYKLS